MPKQKKKPSLNARRRALQKRARGLDLRKTRQGGPIPVNMSSRRAYLKCLQEQYQKASSKKEKGKLLDEYIRNTNHHKKYVIARLNDPNLLAPPAQRRKRKKPMGQSAWGPWLPCGKRLKPMIVTELERLRTFKEISVSDQVAHKLKQMSPATIDRCLLHKKREKRRTGFSTTKPGSLLKKQIPIRLTHWQEEAPGFIEVDLVAHCGNRLAGEFANTLSCTDVLSHWWEGEAFPGKGEHLTLQGIKHIRVRCPFPIKAIDSDNGGEFINHTLHRYCQSENIFFTRSRPYQKNDNAYVEQKNWTHVRKVLGYFRFDTPKEISLINDLYRNELRLYKNFFQPVMRLKQMTRQGAKKKAKYTAPLTPYRWLMMSHKVPPQTKTKLRRCYDQLNPAALKRSIDRKLATLYHVYQAKQKKGGELG